MTTMRFRVALTSQIVPFAPLDEVIPSPTANLEVADTISVVFVAFSTNPGYFVVINASKMDVSRYQSFTDPKKSLTKKNVQYKSPSPYSRLATTSGRSPSCIS